MDELQQQSENFEKAKAGWDTERENMSAEIEARFIFVSDVDGPSLCVLLTVCGLCESRS